MLSEMRAEDFRVGQRVQAHPATDAWMRGDRFGTVLSTSPSRVLVQLDRSGNRVNFHPRNLLHVED